MNPTGAADLAANNPNYQQIVDPYSGAAVMVVPPLKPDVAIVHAQRADQQGNAQIWGILGEQQLAAFASQRVILTVEEVVDQAVIRSDPNRTIIPGMVVDAICHVPYCAHPSYTQGYYDRDNEFYLDWDKVSKTQQGAQDYLDEWVFDLPDRAAYWDKLGLDVHHRLNPGDRFSQPVNYGAY
jgi:glutaconate CoA-transferase subunit A